MTQIQMSPQQLEEYKQLIGDIIDEISSDEDMEEGVKSKLIDSVMTIAESPSSETFIILSDMMQALATEDFLDAELDREIVKFNKQNQATE